MNPGTLQMAEVMAIAPPWFVMRAQKPAGEEVSISLLLQLYRSNKRTKDRLTGSPWQKLTSNIASVSSGYNTCSCHKVSKRTHIEPN
jgi:hypothetical protein